MGVIANNIIIDTTYARKPKVLGGTFKDIRPPVESSDSSQHEQQMTQPVKEKKESLISYEKSSFLSDMTGINE